MASAVSGDVSNSTCAQSPPRAVSGSFNYFAHIPNRCGRQIIRRHI